MLSKEERQKRFGLTEHTMLMFYERGIKENLFPHCLRSSEVWKEFVLAFRDETKSVIVPDAREDADSTHICIFINEGNKVVAIPVKVTNNHIHVYTIKDVMRDDKPYWYISNYNKIAKQRKMPLIQPVVT
ncbi:hypothetical protein KY366_05150 [Candidatus Woesearchaeota archaeon]|nr:hypothetical protein [Candidatus Woesearchaeota archaeon]